MRTQNRILLLVGLLVAIGILISCNKNLETVHPKTTVTAPKAARMTRSTYLSNLVAYKNSPHEIYAGFYRMWGPCYGPRLDSSKIYKVPDSLDVLILFCFNSSSPIAGNVASWVDSLHTKGTKVIMTGSLSLVAGAGSNSAGYAMTAKYIMDSIVTKYHLDGFDVDIESNPSGQTLTDETGVYTALSQYLGPKSGTSKLLTFDTNQPASNSLFQNVYPMVSYVWYQAYGQATSSIETTVDGSPGILLGIGATKGFNSYIKTTQFVPGFSFYEENGNSAGNNWNDISYPGATSGNAFNDTRWEPASGTKKGGVFGYAIDRDQPLTSNTDNTMYYPNWEVSDRLIQIMNPHK